MHKILIIALSILCIVEKVFSQSPIPAKGIENILNQSREYVSQPYFTDTILVKRIDSLMHSTYSGEETFKTVFQVGFIVQYKSQRRSCKVSELLFIGDKRRIS